MDPAEPKTIRYAVVGLGHIAQVAVLPAFKHAEHSSLTALVSGDAVKRKKVGRKYKVPHVYSYEEYDQCLANDEVDAVYIALPNNMHCEYTVRAAEAGKHVLCEKPMAVTEDECRKMIAAVEANNVKLMIAYRLHFEEANLKAIEMVQRGEIGEPRFFSSDFSMQVKDGNIRLDRDAGGGTLYDIGIYCINAVRGLFRAEPTEVFAYAVGGTDERFNEVDEMTAAVLQFSDNRLATIVCSFGASDVSSYRLVGTKSDIRLEPAYEYAGRLALYHTVNDKPKKQTFAKRDQFAAELTYFSSCINGGRDPEPSGKEGMADVRIIEALYRSAEIRHPVPIAPMGDLERPSPEQEIQHPPVSEPELVHAESPH